MANEAESLPGGASPMSELVVVYGSGRIGRAAVRAASAAGFEVVVAGRNDLQVRLVAHETEATPKVTSSRGQSLDSILERAFAVVNAAGQFAGTAQKVLAAAMRCVCIILMCLMNPSHLSQPPGIRM